MWLLFHAWLYLTMSLVFWAKVYMDVNKKRLSWDEKRVDLALDIFLALVFSIGFIDIFFTIPQALKLISLLKGVG
jgi:hypothetical protein